MLLMPDHWTASFLLRVRNRFNIYITWTHLFHPRSQPSRDELEELEEVLELCREDFVRRRAPEMWLGDRTSMPLLRGKLHDLGGYAHLGWMTDQEVVRAVTHELERDRLITCPDRHELPMYVERVRTRRAQRAALYRRPLVRSEPVSLADARPFAYQSDPVPRGATEVAARGVSEAREAECYAQYERDMDECAAYRRAMWLTFHGHLRAARVF